jgi:Fur family ferric uptake transcriptional regulator
MVSGRQTQSIRLVWEVFDRSDNAFSVVELVQMHKDSMNKTTVYRILDRFEKEGKLHKFLGKNGLKWYAKCNNCSSKHHIDIHPHFQCNECGKVECLSIDVKIPKVAKHHIEQANMLLLGQCDECVV